MLRYALSLFAAGVLLPAALETAGSQLLFDYDFDEAFEHYAAVSERFPEHLTGPYNLATKVWSRLAQRSNGMRGSRPGSAYGLERRPPGRHAARRAGKRVSPTVRDGLCPYRDTPPGSGVRNTRRSRSSFDICQIFASR